MAHHLADRCSLHNHLVWKTYWQYFGYNEKGSSLQDHRSHILTFSLAFAY